MIDSELVNILACPWCSRGPLATHIDAGGMDNIRSGILECPSGLHRFVIRSGIPVLLPPGIAPDLGVSTARWRRWRRKLDNFVAWREATYGPQRGSKPAADQDAHFAFQQSFIEFCGLQRIDPAGRVLDVGGAAGDIRTHIHPAWQYCGLDPLPILPQYDFWMVQAVGERMPFLEASFDAVLIMQTLDHCADPEQLLAQARRVVRPGGRLLIQQVVNRVISVAPHRQLWRQVKRLLRYSRADPTDTKMVNYTPNSLQSLVARYFRVLETRTHGNHQVFVSAVQSQSR